jgi:hypothetical protein
MTVRGLAEYVLNHSIDEVIAKCEEILEEDELEEDEPDTKAEKKRVSSCTRNPFDYPPPMYSRD